jgi:nitrite reductase/ring-hydroxylating ferredoxin subunit
MCPSAEVREPVETRRRIRVASAESLPVGGRLLVAVDGVEIALFNVDGELFAINNRCPHRSGPLIRGYVVGRGVKCPMHGWCYDLATGESERPATATVYPVTTDGDGVFVSLASSPDGTRP